MNSVFTLCLMSLIFFHSLDNPMIYGRFVAFDRSYSLMNAHEPRQQFIVEVQNEELSAEMKLIIVVYFAPTTGFRGGAQLLEIDTLNYKNRWKLKLRQPLKKREREACSQIDNFLRSKDGKAYNDKRKEPVVRFRSTQFEADMIFEQLQEMPCMILESIDM